MTRRIASHKGGRTARAPEARIRPQTLERIRETMRERDKSFADLLEEQFPGGNEMVTINIVAQSGHAWMETCDNKAAAKQRAKKVVKEHGDIERVELLTDDGPENIYVIPSERKRKK